MNDDRPGLTRSAALAALAASTAALAASAAPASAAPPYVISPELKALLAQLKPERGVISAAAVKSTGMPLPALMKMLIPWAKSLADPPISNFYVGAIMEGASGALYAGMNHEFPGQTLAFTIHGEGAATNNAWLHDETGIVSLAVGGVPCGYCRQYLSEFVKPEKLTIWMPDGGSVTLSDAMPHAFTPSVLGVTIDPFHARASLTLAAPSDDALVHGALEAATRSHAPYSKTLAGVALRLTDGTVFYGRHAENVAFNPAMPALQSAFIAMRLAGHTYADIAAVALVETAGKASQRVATQAVLGTVSSVKLSYARALLS